MASKAIKLIIIQGLIFGFFHTLGTVNSAEKMTVKLEKDTKEIDLSGQNESSEEGHVARDLFSSLGPAIYQVKTAVSANSPKASYGSAFMIDHKNGFIVTNYHVISSALQDEEKDFKAFVVKGTEVKEAAILAVDIIHDLALLKIDGTYDFSLRINYTPPVEGERVYSIGLPKDLNISIIEGTYNGQLEYGIYQQFLLSSPINSGMSGGPTINSSGDVVGVNVAILLNSQNISFAVPGSHIKGLLEMAKINEHSPINTEVVHDVIQSQLAKIQDSLMGDLNAAEKKNQIIDNWEFLKPNNSLKCWSENQNKQKSTYIMNRQICSLPSNSFIRDGIYTGSYTLQFFSISNKTRNPFQFYYLLNYFYNEVFRDDFLESEEFDEILTKAECSEQSLTNENSIPFKVNYCIKGYIRYPKLYEGVVKAVSLLKGDEAFMLKIKLKGFTKENIKKFIVKHLSNIKLKN